MTELFDKLESQVEQSQQQIRSLMVGLIPVDVEGGGLPAALERLASETTQVHRVACRFECDDDVTLADNFIATQLFLIASEATHNAVKHARADEIVIRLTDHDGGIRVSVTDNGIGLPADAEQIIRHGTADHAPPRRPDRCRTPLGIAAERWHDGKLFLAGGAGNDE